jgi:hypothetical protein
VKAREPIIEFIDNETDVHRILNCPELIVPHIYFVVATRFRLQILAARDQKCPIFSGQEFYWHLSTVPDGPCVVEEDLSMIRDVECNAEPDLKRSDLSHRLS